MNIKYSLILFLYFFGGCISNQRMGQNKIEGFQNKKLKLKDYSLNGNFFTPLKNILIKTDTLYFEGESIDSVFNQKAQWKNYQGNVAFKLGEWKGVKNDFLDTLHLIKLIFRISVLEDKKKLIHEIFKKEIELYYNSLQNQNNSPDFPKLGIIEEDGMYIYYHKKQADTYEFYFRDRLLRIQTLNNAKENTIDRLTNYLFYELIGGVVFKFSQDSFLQPSFNNVMPCEEVINFIEIH